MAVQSELLFQRVPLSIRNMRADVYLLSPFVFLLLLLYSRYRSEKVLEP